MYAVMPWGPGVWRVLHIVDGVASSIAAGDEEYARRIAVLLTRHGMADAPPAEVDELEAQVAADDDGSTL